MVLVSQKMRCVFLFGCQYSRRAVAESRLFFVDVMSEVLGVGWEVVIGALYYGILGGRFDMPRAVCVCMRLCCGRFGEYVAGMCA